MSLQILIVDDHEFVRSGLRSLLSSHSEWTICAEAEDGLQAVEKAKTLRPDVVLMDVSMPRMNGIDATRIIRQEFPESEVIIISQNDPAIGCRQAAEAGAHGFISKADVSRDLVPTIEKVLANRNGKPSVTGDDHDDHRKTLHRHI